MLAAISKERCFIAKDGHFTVGKPPRGLTSHELFMVDLARAAYLAPTSCMVDISEVIGLDSGNADVVIQTLTELASW